MKFRKKPVVIDAFQYLGDDHSLNELFTLFKEWERPDLRVDTDEKGRLSIPTLEGTMLADPGDWIIRGIKGEVYPCKPDIFAATYDAVEG